MIQFKETFGLLLILILVCDCQSIVYDVGNAQGLIEDIRGVVELYDTNIKLKENPKSLFCKAMTL